MAAPSGTLLLTNISHLATMNDELGELTDAAIAIKGNIIEWVGPTSAIPKEFATADKTVDLKGCVVVPGLVNTHCHMFQSLTRCIAQDQRLHGWLKSHYMIWAQMTSHDLYLSTKLAIAELILSGCTTSSDHLYIYPNDCRLDDTTKAAAEMGLRFHAVRGGMSAGVSKGGIAPDNCCEEEEDIIKDAERCIKEMHDNTRLSMLRVAVGPSSQKVVTHTLMQQASALARRYPGVRLHTHLAENTEDIVYSEKMYGYRFKKYIELTGWDQGDVWFAHCCVLNEEEQALFAERGIGIAHCPSSNTRLASGIAPVRQFIDGGINVGLGVDGAASNDTQSLIMEARLAMLLQRAGGNPDGLTVRETLRLATKGGAYNLGRQTEIGEIAPGWGADIVGWQTEGNLGFAGTGADPIGALLLCAPSIGWVDFSCINGRVVVEKGKLLTCDVTQLIKECNTAADKLRERAVAAVGAPSVKEP